MPRILFCCPTPLTLTLGASKVYLEAAEGFRRAGWDSVVIGPGEVGGASPGDLFTQPVRLRDYLRRHASEFHVVEYEHHQLPFDRSDFPIGPLFVARSVLLVHSVVSADIPRRSGVRQRVNLLMKGWWARTQSARLLQQADETLAAADLINVCNSTEKNILIKRGFAKSKICAFPYGMFPERLDAFRGYQDCVPDRPVVGFVGTFEPRKGMSEFPALVDQIAREVPTVTFRLLGTAGLVRDADGVRRCFPRRLWPRLKIHPRYEPDDLPRLLAGVSVGIFPSRVESFGYGVLEMLASAVPVIAYAAPGPNVMLAPEFMVPVGSHDALARRVIALLTTAGELSLAREWARRRALDFNWERICELTADRYQEQRFKLSRISSSQGAIH